MADEGSFYKRIEDKDWRDEVDARLVSLTSAAKTTQDDIDELANQLATVDELLHGDRRDRDTGVVGQLNRLETDVNLILRIFHGDNLGHGGLLKQHTENTDFIKGKKADSDNRWKFWTAVVVALISTIGLLVVKWPSISAAWEKEQEQEPKSQVGKMINRAKHPVRKHYVTKIVPAPAEDPPSQ